MQSGNPSLKVLERTKLFHTDSVICGISALGLLTNAPTVLKAEALNYRGKYKGGNSNCGNVAKCFGSDILC